MRPLGLKLAEDASGLVRCLTSLGLLIGDCADSRRVRSLGLLKLIGGPDQRGFAGVAHGIVAGRREQVGREERPFTSSDRRFIVDVVTSAVARSGGRCLDRPALGADGLTTPPTALET